MTALRKSADTRFKLLRMAGLAVAGAVVGYASASLVIEYAALPSIEGLRWSDAVALMVALMLAGGGVSVLVAARNGRALAAVTSADAPAGSTEVRDMRLQGAVLVLSGLLLAAPVAAVLAGNAAPVPTLVAMAVVFVLHSAMNLRLWRRGDEMIRRVILESGALAFWTGQVALFGWAAAERLGVAPGLTAWDILVVVMGLYLACSAIVGLRRGLS